MKNDKTNGWFTSGALYIRRHVFLGHVLIERRNGTVEVYRVGSDGLETFVRFLAPKAVR